MNDYFKISKTHNGQEVTLLVNSTPEKEGVQVIETGEFIDHKGKLFWYTLYIKEGRVVRQYGLVQLKNGEVDFLTARSPDNGDKEQEWYPAFTQLKEGATEIDDRQLKVILEVIERKMKENL